MFGSYFAFDHVHTPQFGAPPDGSEPSPRGPFGDALLQTDAAVGVVLQELRQAPHRGRTLALLTSDNGAPSGGTVISGLNAPFVGTKFQTWEGELSRYRWHLGCILLKMPAISLLTGGVRM